MTSTPSGPYAALIELARIVVALRARRYRQLVVALSAMAMVATVGAMLYPDARWLLVVGMLPTTVGIFFVADARAVHAWREHVLQRWREGEVRIDLLRTTLRQVPGLPPLTLEGLLEALPNWIAVDIPAADRSMLHRLQSSLSRAARDAMGARVAIWTLAVMAPTAAWFAEQPRWLTLWVLMPVAFAVRCVVAARHVRSWQRLLSEARGRPDESSAAVTRLLEGLSWQEIPQSQRRRLLELSVPTGDPEPVSR